MPSHLGNYVRTERMKAGLSVHEVGVIMGYDHGAPISRHERSEHIPPLIVAISYAVLYKKSISELFPGLHETVERHIESRIAELESNLRQRGARGPRAAQIARKLEWFAERRTLGHA